MDRWIAAAQQTAPKHRNQRPYGGETGVGGVTGTVTEGVVRVTCVVSGVAVTVCLDAGGAEELAARLRVWAEQARRG